jgi:hypothetical protein
MLNYKSVRSSEPQIRSNPALRHVSSHSGFHKRLSSLLESTPLPFPTYQIVKDNSQLVLENHPHYAWVRPSYLRSQWLVLNDTMPLVLWDPRDETRVNSLRVPFDKKRIQEVGTVVCEAAWDAQDHVLYIWDVIVWERSVIWNTMPYSKRWGLVKEIVGQILDCGHPMSDAEVRVPAWESLAQVAERTDLDPATSIDFQPEKAGQRRRIFLVQDEGVKFRPTTHAERKMVADAAPTKHTVVTLKQNATHMKYTKPSTPQNIIVPIPVKTLKEKRPSVLEQLQNDEEKKENTLHQPHDTKSLDAKPVVERQTVARLTKDISKLPDTYRLTSIAGENLGLAAIRSMEMSKRLRELIKKHPAMLVDISWVEPFKKYEIKFVHIPSE